MVQGLLAGLAYWVLGVPFAALWGSPRRSLRFFRWRVCDRFSAGVDRLISSGRDGAQHRPFFGILGGLALFGAVGIVLGPVLFALLRALLELYPEEYSRIERP